MFKKLFGMNKKKDTDRQIVELQNKLEDSKRKIRYINNDMKRLVQQATEADDLDKKILALDYEAKKSELATETERFQDLRGLISKLQSIQAIDENRRHLDKMTEVSDELDIRGLIRQEDEINARRSMLQEEEEAYAAVRAERVTGGTFAAEQEDEFMRMVDAAKLEKRKAVHEAEEAQAEAV